jgi:hypothetical protein
VRQRGVAVRKKTAQAKLGRGTRRIEVQRFFATLRMTRRIDHFRSFAPLWQTRRLPHVSCGGIKAVKHLDGTQVEQVSAEHPQNVGWLHGNFEAKNKKWDDGAESCHLLAESQARWG